MSALPEPVTQLLGASVARPAPWAGPGAEARALVRDIRRRLAGRDLALIGAGLTFYAGIAVVPLFAVAFALTGWLSSPDRVRELTGRLASVLPPDIGAPEALTRLVDAALGLDWLRVLLALFPMSFYGEGLRRALLRFSDHRDTLTGWRGRLLILPLVLLTPALLYPLLLVGAALADMSGHRGGFGYGVTGVVIGYYSVLGALTLPLVWGFRVVAPARLRWRAVVPGALFTAACLSGFLQGFVLFLDLPLDIGAPFGGLTAVGGVVALGLWLFLLHLVVIGGWLVTQALHDRLTSPAP